MVVFHSRRLLLALGPMVWQACLGTLNQDGGPPFAYWWEDATAHHSVFARLEPGSGEEIRQVLFEKLIEENGAAFGLQIFGSLPSNTHNKAEDLIPEEAVRRSYWNWMLWAERTADADWTSLAEEVSARARSPITYPRDLLNSFASIENPGSWLEARRDRNGRLSLRAKRAIFDAYFKLSYGPY